MEQLNNKLIEASKMYGDQTIVRTMINAIPYVGSSIDLLLSSAGHKFTIKRIEKFIDALKEEISRLKEAQINKDFLNTEEGFDLIIKALNSAARTRHQEKLNLFALIVKSALTKDKFYEEDEPEFFLKIVEELSINEFKVAKYLYELKEMKKEKLDENNANKKGMTNDASVLSQCHPEFDENELVSTFVRLERIGLIKELVGTYVGYSGGVYLVNPLFRRLMNFIETVE